jgi:hypothetical protein
LLPRWAPLVTSAFEARLSEPLPLMGGDQLFGGDDALVFELFARNDFHRQCALLGDALDARAGDLDPLHRPLVLGLRDSGHYSGRDRADQGHHPCQFLEFHVFFLFPWWPIAPIQPALDGGVCAVLESRVRRRIWRQPMNYAEGSITSGNV